MTGYHITFSLNEIERLFYTPAFLRDCNSCTVTQMITKCHHMTAGHSQISTYYNNESFKIVGIRCLSVASFQTFTKRSQ